MKKILTTVICLGMLLVLSACEDRITPKEVGEMLRNEGIEVKFGDGMEKDYYDYILDDKIDFEIQFKEDLESLNDSKASYSNSKSDTYTTFTVNDSNLIVYHYRRYKKEDPALEAKIERFVEQFDKAVKDK